jgi:hypothetical protein
MHYLRNLQYILRHKWFVFIACCRLGIPWQGITHDLSKFSQAEFGPYARYFFGGKKNQEEFDLAWLHHVHHNPHHWLYWVLPGDETSKPRVFEMPGKYRLEMLADWEGAARAKSPKAGEMAARHWYLKQQAVIILHPATREAVKWYLEIG